jgi:hypothetical protein
MSINCRVNERAVRALHRSIRGVSAPLWKTALMAALASAAPNLADASWKGKSLGWQYYAYGGPYDNLGSPGTCTVGKKNVCGTFQGYFNIITTPKSITFDYSVATGTSPWSSSELSLPPTIYNGIAINLTSPGKIKSVTIDPKTNMAGFDSSHLSFTNNQIQVDWADLPFTTHTKVKLDVTVTKGAYDRPPGRAVNTKPAALPVQGHTAPARTPNLSLSPPIR